MIEDPDFDEFSYSNEHDAFAATRCAEYVYFPISDDYFDILNKHAETIEMDSKLPLVVVGEPGVGKNALLSNWEKKRRETKHKDEFLFKYYAAASSVASKLSAMLHTLETELKNFFQLREMEVPTSELRLLWSMNRFLSAAAKRYIPTRIVIIIDGVYALRGENMPVGSLHWLPVELPPGVRFIVSTVQFNHQHQPTNGVQKEHRTFSEFKRRNYPLLQISRLPETAQYSIIKKFIETQTKKETYEILKSEQIESTRNKFKKERNTSSDETFSVDTTKQIIKKRPSDIKFNSFTLTEEQIKKIISINVENKPMYLRTFLYGMQLCLMTEPNTSKLAEYFDVLIDNADTESLTSKILDICAWQMSSSNEGTNIISAVLSVVYASNDGLSENEIWGATSIILGYELNDRQMSLVQKLLKVNCMRVNNRYSFIHEEFKQLVFSKYIKTAELNVKLHHQMALFFSKLPACDRRVWCLPHHLEVAGNWQKLKSCLVDITMLDIWWTETQKQRFLDLWLSLTATKGKSFQDSTAFESELAAENNKSISKKPQYDVVDEYCHALEEYKDKYHPSDIQVGAVIIKIADFFLEYAAKGYEELADVPNFVHPKIPQADLASLGVEYLSTDKEGYSVLHRPILTQSSEENAKFGTATKQNSSSQCSASINELPIRSTYFYNRWMWIQFPSIALSNCGHMYRKGMEVRKKLEPPSYSASNSKNSKSNGAKGKNVADQNLNDESSTPSLNELCSTDELNLNFQSSQKLPDIGILSPVKPRVKPGDDGKETHEESYWANALEAMKKEVISYRTCLNALVQRRQVLNRKLAQTENEEIVLEISVVTQADGDVRMSELKEKMQNVVDETQEAAKLTKNYESLLKMCKRHPAHSRALIAELESKLSQDTKLMDEIRKRFQREREERINTTQTIHDMQRAQSSMHYLQKEMIDSKNRQLAVLRYSLKMEIKTAYGHQISGSDGISVADSEYSNSTVNRRLGINGKVKRKVSLPSNGSRSQLSKDEEIWRLISCTTGINDPSMFAAKFLNTEILEHQISSMKQKKEQCLSDLRAEAASVESELANMRYVQLSSGGRVGGQGGQDTRNLHSNLSEAQATLRNRREKTYAIEKLRRSAMTGLRHVCDILGIVVTAGTSQSIIEGIEGRSDNGLNKDLSDQVSKMVHQIEFVLDSLMDENDKSVSQSSMPHSATTSVASFGQERLDFDRQSLNAAANVTRPPEVEVALQQFINRKIQMAAQLLAENSTSKDSEVWSDDDDADSGIHTIPDDRNTLKANASKMLRAEMRKQAKVQKTAAA